MQNRHIAMGIFLLSLLLSSWLYWGSDFKLEQVLTSREWQSKMVSLIKTNSNSPAIRATQSGRRHFQCEISA